MKCTYCEIGCTIQEKATGQEGATGACRMYECHQGKIVERFPDQYLTIFPISIETMPMLHFFPRGKFLQLSTVGCNFHCTGCISEVIVLEYPVNRGDVYV